MRKSVKLILTCGILVLISLPLFAQAIPQDSLFLGQTPPGTAPEIFTLPVAPGSFAAERIAISGDGKEIYYSGIRSYYPTAGDTIKYYRYTENGWTGPFNLFNGFLAPCLSVSGDTMYMQNNIIPYQMLYSVRNGTVWSTPQRFLNGLNSAHYFQVTNNYHGYIASVSSPTLGASDWCRVKISKTDTTAVSLGLPVCTAGDNLDFFISRDESFIITANPQPKGLSISYHKNDGGWTNPKSLGPVINFGLGMWGPYVTSNNKYLFYTTGTKQNYSDTYIRWVRVDNLIDSLRHTNFIPYLTSKIPNQTDSVGYKFHYTFPESTFIDDDGNNTLTYTATLINGNPLPSWLSFYPETRTFDGTPSSVANYSIKVTATDSAGEVISSVFTLRIQNPVADIGDDRQGLNDFRLFQNYPNPFNPATTIEFAVSKPGRYSLNLYNTLGELVKTISDKEYETGFHKEILEANELTSGVYLYCLKGDEAEVVRKMILMQ
ncbi:MAG: putative Ig domain-containing protein [Ignavibacteriaceae bacterium]|jgi:hypothetical protein|nr:putative Ig domain-containing protein [Ignavibacteriaceae bacterium]